MAVLTSKRYLQVLFILLGMIMFITFGYTYQFSKKYPLPFTNRISFDAKIKFIKEHIDPRKVDTLIVGSSIGLNNVQGAYLEKASKKCKGVLNFSVYEASPVQASQVLELIGAFPNLKRVVYSAQFSDFQHSTSFRDYKPKDIENYISYGFHPGIDTKMIVEASKDLAFLKQRGKEWKSKHGQRNKFTYLGFDHTGSVPLHIYEKDTYHNPFNAKRWNNPHGSLHPPKALKALDEMAKKMQEKGLRFYFVQQPYRQALIKKYPHVLAELNWFLDIVTKIVHRRGGKVLSLYKTLPLSDAYFADRSHLNEKGSILGAEAIAKFIDAQEK